MTYANIVVNGADFHVEHDGGDKEGIKNSMQDIVKDLKKKVSDKKYIPEFLIERLIAESDDYYEWIHTGPIEFASHNYIVTVKEDKIKIKEEKRK